MLPEGKRDKIPWFLGECPASAGLGNGFIPVLPQGGRNRVYRYSRAGAHPRVASLGLCPIHLLQGHPHPPQCAHWGTFPLEGGRLGGRSGMPPLQSGWKPAPSSASHSLGTFPPRGRLSGDRKGRPYGGYGSSSIFLVGAGPRPARQDSYRERWLGKPRRRYWTAPAAFFAPPGPSGPAGIQTDHSDFARRKRCTAYQEVVPRNGVRGKRPMGLGGA